MFAIPLGVADVIVMGFGLTIALASHGNLTLGPFLMRIHTYACKVEMP